MDTATLAYNSVPRGVTAAALITRMAAAVLPRDVLIALGLRVTADGTAGGAIVTRTITVSFIPSVVAMAVPVVGNDGRVASMTVTAVAGLDYILPPHVTIVDPNRRQSHTDGLPPGGPDTAVGNLATFQSRLKVAGTTLVSGGAGYGAATAIVGFIGGLPPANRLGLVPEARSGDTDLTLPPTGAVVTGCVRAVSIKDPGQGYPANTEVFFEGGGETNPGFIRAQGRVVLSPTGRILGVTIIDMGANYTSPPNVVFRSPSPVIQNPPRRIAQAFASMAQGRPARATTTVLAGVITALTITDEGFNYVEPPLIVITDPLGTGASAIARMGVGVINVICPGTGYAVSGLTAANVIITPQFKRSFPDASDQRAPFWRLFETLIASTAITPVNSDAPVLA